MAEFNEKCSIERNEELGRHLIAAANIKTGETLLNEPPTLILPCTGVKRCVNCYMVTENFCSTCRIFSLCDNCPQHNAFDCNFFAGAPLSGEQIRELQRSAADVYASLKCFLLRENTETIKYFEEFMQLEAYTEERRDTEIWSEHRKKVVEPLMNSGVLDFINKSVTEQIDAELLQHWSGIIDVNSFEIRAPESVTSMRAMYLKGALLAHHCVANTAIAIDDKYQMKIYANRDIPTGEMVYNCYTNVLLGTDERRHILKMGKYFHCKCERCEDPTELGSHMSSLICSPCAGNQREGFIIKNKEKQWKCSECGHILKTEFVESILDRAKEEIFHAKDDIYRYELLLAKLSRILHPNHYLMIDMKQNIAAILRSIIMNLAHRPGRKVYERKVRLCQEILTVLQIIQPGISRLKAIALYELCNSLAELGRLKLSEREYSNAQLLLLLKQCEGMLRESIRMLLYEPVETPEGKLAKSMLKELKDLQVDMSLISDNENGNVEQV